MPPRTATLLIGRDIGAAWGRTQAEELTRHLELRLKQPVVLCWADDSVADFSDSIQSLVNAEISRLIVSPLGLLPIPETGPIPLALARAGQQWPSLTFHTAAPLTWLDWAGWLQRTAIDNLTADDRTPESSALLLVGRGSSSALENADLARLAQLLRDTGPFALVEHAFVEGTRPSIPDAIRHVVDAGLSTAVAVPWLLDEEGDEQQFRALVGRDAGRRDIDVRIAIPQLAHPALVNLLVSNHLAALAERPIEFGTASPAAGPGRPLAVPDTAAGISPEEAYELQQLQRRINALLPSEYKGRFEEVSPQSMGSAGLKYDNEGKVAWGEIWTSFCDLALAGGPPHRGKLLEAVTAADALADEDNYKAVVAEIERGIRLVTSLPVVSSAVAGWVGVRCESEEMAVWLMRAIIVENIMVRREGDTLYLPAGPQFTLKREIKNVITAIAKTTHYWKAHLLTRRQSDDLQ